MKQIENKNTYIRNSDRHRDSLIWLLCLLTVDSGRVYGVDISELAHYECEENLFTEISLGKVHLMPSSVEHIPLNSNSIDKAFSCNSFYFWPSIPKGCTELHRLLKPGAPLLTVQNIDSVLKRKKAGGFEQANVDFVAFILTLEKVGFVDVKMEYHTDEATGKNYEVIRATASWWPNSKEWYYSLLTVELCVYYGVWDAMNADCKTGASYNKQTFRRY